MDFARKELLKYGWQDGKGLGRNESGITTAIKPKLKFDNHGIGHDASEQFTYHWWEHAFNKAANNIQVDTTKEGVTVNLEDDDLDITTKKYSKKKLQKENALKYGTFLKTSTLTQDGQMVRTLKETSGDEQKEVEPAFETLTDEDLLKICNGRTAHKGARHGLKLSGKLARLEKQEEELLAKFTHRGTSNCTNGTDDNPRTQESSNLEQEKKVKKRKKKIQDSILTDDQSLQSSTADSINKVEPDLEQEKEVTKRKKKIQDSILTDEQSLQLIADGINAVQSDLEQEKKVKKRKKKIQDRMLTDEQLLQCGTDCDFADSINKVEPEIKKKKKNEVLANETSPESEIGIDEFPDCISKENAGVRKSKKVKDKRKNKTEIPETTQYENCVQQETYSCKKMKKTKKDRGHCFSDNQIEHIDETIQSQETECEDIRQKKKKRNQEAVSEESEINSNITDINVSYEHNETKKKKRKKEKGL